MKKTPVILDTDIGLDIDDTWALAFLLKCPEFDVKLITTALGDAGRKAALAARILESLGRTDIPIGIGRSNSMILSPQIVLAENFRRDLYRGTIFDDGIHAMADTIMSSPESVTVIAIGPATNLAACLELEPGIVNKSRIVGMYGSIRKGYDNSPAPCPECNVVCDVSALRKIIDSEWPLTITPLDTCGDFRLDDDMFTAFASAAESKPLPKLIIDHYLAFLGSRDLPKASTTLFDVIAVYLALNNSAFVLCDINLAITDDGITIEDSRGRTVQTALSWASENEKEVLAGLLMSRLVKWTLLSRPLIMVT